MYSALLMVALSGGSATPAGLFHHDCGCAGCSSSCAGCSCSGYYGGHSGFPNLLGWLSFGHGHCSVACGCFGGYSGSCSSCHGGCHTSHFSCHGCSGCHGSLFAGHGCHGCHASHTCSGFGLLGCLHQLHSCHGCNGCNGCNGCTGCAGGVIVQPAPGAPAPAPKSEPVPAPKKTSIEGDNRAVLTVEVPADAKLFVDGYETRADGKTVRAFTTPELEAGQDYGYTLKIETVRDGKTVTETKQVTVRAGEETRASFNDAKVVSVSNTN